MEEIRFEVVKKLAETKFKFKDLKNVSQFDSASPPSVFVGSKLKYPLMNVGILSPLQKEEDAWIYDDAKYWAENNFQISDVLGLRESLLNSRFKTTANAVRASSQNNKILEIAKNIAIAQKPVDIEIKLKKQILVDKKRDRVNMPSAIGAPLENARITSNVKISQKVDRVINDDIKSTQGIEYLYKNNFNEYTLSKILSIGALGLKKDKKLVPTRWSITATDDIIGKQLLEKIKEYKWIENYEFTFGEFLGNQYLILFFPNVWNYELFELYYPGSSWNPSAQIKASTDFENFYGRKEYAFNCAGGYYATRLAILEYLENKKRQASVLVIRLETPSYWAALGVWVVRESVRKALAKEAMKFNSREELIESCRKIGKIKYDFDSELIFKKSKLLENLKTIRRLSEWI